MHAPGGSAEDEMAGESGRRLRWAQLCERLWQKAVARTRSCALRRVRAVSRSISTVSPALGTRTAAELGKFVPNKWCAATVRCRRAMWRDYARLGALAAIWLVMVGSYWTHPAPASLAGIALPKDVGRWLNRGALCREVAGRCAKGNNCGDGVNERCGRAASAAVLRASGRCRGALAAIEPADGAAPVVARARDCLRHAYRYAFRGEGLPVPRLVGDV